MDFLEQCTHILGEDILFVEDRTGSDQEVKILTTKKHRYVAKLPKKDNVLLYREQLACNTLTNIPCPKIVHYSKDLLIQEFIEGEPIDKAKMTKSERLRIYEELGALLKKMHCVKSKGFGYIGFDKKGIAHTQEEDFLSFFNPQRLKLVLEEKEIDLAQKYFDTHKKRFLTKNPVLIHADLHDGHVIIQDKKIAGIIDFGDLSSGSPIQDFHQMYNWHYGTQEFASLLKGYGVVNEQEVEFYAFLSMSRKLPNYKEKGREKRFLELRKKYEDIIRERTTQ